MRNSLLKLGALALTVLGSGAWLVACGSEPHGGPLPYSPFKISIDSIEARGELNVEEKEELFLLNKGNELILEIPKFEEFGLRGFTIVGNQDRVTDQTLPLHERLVIDHVIQLKTDNPDVWLCRSVIVNENTSRNECRTEITTNLPTIGVRPQKLRDVVKSAGVFNQGVADTILRLELDGKIDDQHFSIMGRVIYDDTEQSRLAYDEKIRPELEDLERARSQNRDRVRSNALKGVTLFAFAIAIILVPIIWLVSRLRRSKRRTFW